MNFPTDKIKLVVLLIILMSPIPIAWGMWYWQLAVPSAKVAHGYILPELDNIRDWPLVEPIHQRSAYSWYLIFRCQSHIPDCQLRDEMWRLHRALGRQADRVQRWYLLPGNSEDPIAGELLGEHVARLYEAVSLDDFGSYMIWLADPDGEVVVSYGGTVQVTEVLADLRYLLRRNPGPPRWQATNHLQSGHRQSEAQVAFYD